MIQRIRCWFGIHPKDESEVVRCEPRMFHTGSKITMKCKACFREWTYKTGGKMWGG